MEVQDLEKIVKEQSSTHRMERDLARSAAFPALMRKVYLWMTMALVITGLCAWGTATSPAMVQLVFGNRGSYLGTAYRRAWPRVLYHSSYQPTVVDYRHDPVHHLFGAQWCDAIVHFYGLRDDIHREGVLHYSRYLWRDGALRISDEDRSLKVRQPLSHGALRFDHCYVGQLLYQEQWL